MKWIIALIILSWTNTLWAQSKKGPKKKIITKYKEYEKIDLGKLSIEGEFTSPSDIFIEQRNRKDSGDKFYERKDFSREIHSDSLKLK